MASFDYIPTPELRQSLESDYGELRRCIDINASKAVHVLAGSIVEALLTDLLVSLQVMNEADAYRLSFGDREPLQVGRLHFRKGRRSLFGNPRVSQLDSPGSGCSHRRSSR
jgi:hypothetical protein